MMQGHEVRCKGCRLVILCTKAGCAAEDHLCYTCLYAARQAAEKQEAAKGGA
jgi:hypothetical protein